jgi:hypothetical protein
MELLDGLPDATVPVVRRFPLPDLHPADAIPLAPHASDASAAVPPDEAADATVPALADAPYAEKLAVPAPVAQAPAAELRLRPTFPAEAKAPCKPGAALSGA